MREKLQTLPLAVLRELAKDKKVKHFSTMKKADLIEAILLAAEEEKTENSQTPAPQPAKPQTAEQQPAKPQTAEQQSEKSQPAEQQSAKQQTHTAGESSRSSPDTGCSRPAAPR